MSLKAQGTDINRTLLTFLAPADIGAFNRGVVSTQLRGDSLRKIKITGFCFDYRVGAPADVNANSFMEVALIETANITGESAPAFIYGDFASAIRFHFGAPAINFQNLLEEQFTEPFKLTEGLTYTFIGTITYGAGAPAGTATTFLTLFGFEEGSKEAQTYYSHPR